VHHDAAFAPNLGNRKRASRRKRRAIQGLAEPLQTNAFVYRLSVNRAVKMEIPD
jgi:hypothetical protein